jgi:acetyltransferase-like isoleucine patch superfamily enzyme
VFEAGARVVVLGELDIGDDVYIGRDTVIVAHNKVFIGNGTLFGERVSVHDEDHGPPDARQAFRTKPVTIGRYVWLAAGVVVTSGSKIGEGATIGANAVVTGVIPSGVTAVGVPARSLNR